MVGSQGFSPQGCSFMFYEPRKAGYCISKPPLVQQTAGKISVTTLKSQSSSNKPSVTHWSWSLMRRRWLPVAWCDWEPCLRFCFCFAACCCNCNCWEAVSWVLLGWAAWTSSLSSGTNWAPERRFANADLSCVVSKATSVAGVDGTSLFPYKNQMEDNIVKCRTTLLCHTFLSSIWSISCLQKLCICCTLIVYACIWSWILVPPWPSCVRWYSCNCCCSSCSCAARWGLMSALKRVIYVHRVIVWFAGDWEAAVHPHPPTAARVQNEM